jgi:hypothetical protein
MSYLRCLLCVLILNALPVLAEDDSANTGGVLSDGALVPDAAPDVTAAPETSTESPSQQVAEAAPAPQVALPRYYVGANYSYFDLILPSKYGFSLGYIDSPKDTYEFEYLRASVSIPVSVVKDLGSFSEVRMSLLDRHFFSEGSFNALWGVVYNSNKLEIGNTILSRISSQSIPQVKPLEVDTLGLVGGVGNRWRFSHGITFGADWFTWAQPLIIIKKENQFRGLATNESDKNNIDTAVKVLSYFPRLSVLKVNLGISF